MSTDLDTQVVAFVRGVLGAMGLDLEASLEEREDNVRLNLSGEGADVLLRRKGEALDALQVIVNTAFRRDARGDRHYVIDALDYRRGKDAQEIGPLNPYARRIVHLAVAEATGVTSESVGDAFLKTVVISPE